MIAICIGRFDLTMNQAERTTWREYQIYSRAYEIKRNERTANNAQIAFFNQAVQATTGSKKNPKPKYPHLKDFYDEVEEFWNVFREERPEQKKRLDKQDRLSKLNQLL